MLWLNHPGTAARLELLRLVVAERGSRVDDRQLRDLAEKCFGAGASFAACSSANSMSPLGRRTIEWSSPWPDGQGSHCRRCPLFWCHASRHLRGPARRKSLVFARSVAVYLLRTLTQRAMPRLAGNLAAEITRQSCTQWNRCNWSWRQIPPHNTPSRNSAVFYSPPEFQCSTANFVENLFVTSSLPCRTIDSRHRDLLAERPTSTIANTIQQSSRRPRQLVFHSNLLTITVDHD